MDAERCTVLIVGGGPTGLAAALELRRLGVDGVRIVEREPEAGGTPRQCHHTGFGLRDLHRMLSGPGYARAYRQRAADAGVAISTTAMVTAWAAPHTLAVTSRDGVRSIAAQSILLATGCRERPQAARLVPGSRAQGVFTTGSLQRFVHEHGVFEHGQRLGARAVVIGAEAVSLSCVFTLLHAGVEEITLVTEHPTHQFYPPYLPAWWYVQRRFGVKLAASARITRVAGTPRVEGAELTPLDGSPGAFVPCDTLVFTGSWSPEYELARLGGLVMDPATKGPRIDAAQRTSAPGVFAAGNLVHGAVTADQAALEGRHAAHGIAGYLQGGVWPQTTLPILAEPPIAWVTPNCAAPADSQSSHRGFYFQVGQFCQGGQVHVYQGRRLLHRQLFHRLGPNQTYWLSACWLPLLDRSQEAVRLVLQ